MKSGDFTPSHTPKMSPYCNNMDVLVQEAVDSVDADLVDVHQVPVNKILFTQPTETAPNDKEFSRHDNLPFAVLMDGFYHLLDGHGYVMDAINDGYDKVLLYTADGDDEELIEAKRKKKKHKKKKKSHAKKSPTYVPVLPFYGRWWYGGYHDHNDEPSGAGDTGPDVGGDVGGGDGGGE